MWFEVKRKHQQSMQSQVPCPKIRLYEDLWNDWFEFVTMFNVSYIDEKGSEHRIGNVKIGQFNMNIKQPEIQECFEMLGEEFFSLGQDDDYYENLNRLGDETRKTVLVSLRDIAFDENLFEKAKREKVTTDSLMRDIPSSRVKTQFARMANGGARLTSYNFTYNMPCDLEETPVSLDFHVKPQSNPPTNIHVIIGRNGVGKTHLIKNMINSLIYNDEEKFGSFKVGRISKSEFINLVCVAFSPFDEFPKPNKEMRRTDNDSISMPYKFIGLEYIEKDQSKSRLEYLLEQFWESVKTCRSQRSKQELWIKVVSILESDPIFKEAEIKSLMLSDEKEFENAAKNCFNRLSSGHKVVLITITRLVETVSEKTMVLLDEPENHLHPPLVSSFIRALSELLIDRNGIAVVATHSPVILQEVPSSCVWKIRRSGRETVAERLTTESFGGTIASLISEVFGLEVSNSGFHKLISDALIKKGYDYDEVVDYFNDELGLEAKMLLRTIIATLGEEIDD